MILSPQDKIALSLKAFRNAFGAQLCKVEATKLWGDTLTDQSLKEFPLECSPSKEVVEKLDIANILISKLSKIGVKYIGVSGSVGVGTAQSGDDIDLFIVVADNFSWIYRVYSKIRLGNDAVWYGHEEKKNKLCINFICEEKGLDFENHDIFTFNEIISLKGIYNDDFWEEMALANHWVFEDFLVENKYGDKKNSSKCSKLITLLLYPVNFLFFIAQLGYMTLLGHNPDYQRLFKGFGEGQIQFYPDQFREEKLRTFKPTT